MPLSSKDPDADRLARALAQRINRTPGPPPFSSMNSTPALSRARLIARSFAVVNAVSLAYEAAMYRTLCRAAMYGPHCTEP